MHCHLVFTPYQTKLAFGRNLLSQPAQRNKHYLPTKFGPVPSSVRTFYENTRIYVRTNMSLSSAQAALPSLVSLALGASRVVITDFPNEKILDNIKRMVIQNKFKLEHQAYVREHAWGSDTQECLDLSYGSLGFDVVLLCESFWNATYRLHQPLLASLYKLLSMSGVAIVSFSHHITDDHPPERDLSFFILQWLRVFW